MKKPLILVTNDDGITAGGIKALIEVASQLGQVVVVSPDSPQSGMGHAITISNPLWLRETSIFGPDIEAFECSGTPVDCVKLAKSVVLHDRLPALCVSGINHGSNASTNILYSGTLSAAMEASLEGIPSIGFSLLDYRHDADFKPAQSFVRRIMEYVLANGLAEGSLLNVNIPALPEKEIKGIRICRQANARWTEEFQQNIDPRGRTYYWMTGKFQNMDDHADADVRALEEGYISVVPSMHDLTNYRAIPSLQGLSE